MNYLAHCYLSCTDEDILIGNFITDFLKKKEEADYSGRVLEGIKLHRAIDTFTDSHPASLELRQLLRPNHGKYSAVVVDLVWDHFLSINWDKYSGTQLESFNADVYAILEKRKAELPDKLKSRLDRMIETDVLMAYSSEARMLKALDWMDKRVKFPSNFVSAVDDINNHRDRIDDLFNSFFPELITVAEAHCSC